MTATHCLAAAVSAHCIPSVSNWILYRLLALSVSQHPVAKSISHCVCFVYSFILLLLHLLLLLLLLL